MICKKCGHEFEGKFCPECGTPVAPQERICNQCHTRFVGNFCPQCGTPVEQSSSIIPAKPNPAPIISNTKKKRHGCLFSIFVVIIFFFVLCMILAALGGDNSSSVSSTSVSHSSSDQNSSPAESDIDTSSSTVSSSSFSAPTSAPSSGSSSSLELSMEELIPMVEPIIAENFEHYSLSYDDTGLTLSVWDDDVAAGTALVMAGNSEAQDAWDSMKENLITLCSSMRDLLDTAGLEDASVTLNLLNDLNTDNILLCIIDGVPIYDATVSS